MLPTFSGTQSRQPTLSSLTTATSPFTLQLAAATMVAVNLTPAKVRNMGLQMAGFTPERQERTCLATNLARFRSAFGVSPEAIASVLHDLQTTQIVAARDNNLNVYYFLLSVNWCREYKTEKSMAGHYRMDEKTIRSWAFYNVSKIQALKPQKISARSEVRERQKFSRIGDSKPICLHCIIVSYTSRVCCLSTTDSLANFWRLDLCCVR
jgi:hypothetical protein